MTLLGRWTAGLLAAAVVVLPQAAYADGQASIDHVQQGQGAIKVLVSVPSDADIDLGSVTATLDGADAQVSAENAASADSVRRLSVLALDTSRSMAGPRIREAKKAAETYLSTVPANVEVGVVTFDRDVKVLLEPTRDRAAALAAVKGVTLALQTSLYDGIAKAIDVLGPAAKAQRSLLVLSDGTDTTSTPLPPLLTRVSRSKVALDVISLQQGGAATQPLEQLATAAGGRVIAADQPRALSDAFTSEADALARQVVVDVAVPAGKKGTDANLSVSLTAGGQTYTSSAIVPVRAAASTATPVAAPPTPISGGFEIPRVAVWVGIGALGVGLLGLLGLLFSSGRGNRPLTVAEQIQAYGASAPQHRAASTESAGLAQQAKDVAQKALEGNEDLENRIAGRLEAAGLSLRPAEWLLTHAGLALALTLVIALLSGFNALLIVLALFFGAVLPWVWLGMKKSARLKAFDSGLADTLQLMAGSLSAGLSLAQSVDTIVREGADPIRSEFKRVIVESRLGVTLEDAMEGVADRMQSRDFEWVVMAIRIQREVGGNLAELLLTVAATLREREYLRRHVRALSAEGRLSAYVLGGLPPVFLLYLIVTKPDYTSPMFTTPIGWVMIIAMVVLLSVGVFWMMKVAKVEV